MSYRNSYKNLKYIPTKKLQEILDSNHCTGIDGADYEPVREELEQILWERQNRQADAEMKKMEKEWEAYENYLEVA